LAAALAITAGVVIAVAVGQPPDGALQTPAASPAAVATHAPSSSAGEAGSPSLSATPSGAPASPSPTGSPVSVPVASSAWSLPAGWRYELVCEDSPCVLHLFDASDREPDGWPVAIDGDCPGWVAVGPDESAFVPCTRNGRAIVNGLARDGSALAGWPVNVKGSVAWSTWNDFAWTGGASIAVGPDGAVYVAVDPGHESYRIVAFDREGRPKDGWPRDLGGFAQGFRIAGDGIVAWWYEGVVPDTIDLQARRTRFTLLDGTGHALPGWPIGSTGAASGPVVSRDGMIFYTSASGKVWGHDRSGKVVTGWPYQLPYPIAPILRADGTLLFVGSSSVHVVDRRGKVPSGWPWRTRSTLDAPGCDTDSIADQVFALTTDDTLYVAPWDGSASQIVGLSSGGAPITGWPYHVPKGWRVTGLTAGADGSVTAALSGGECFSAYDQASIQLSGTGEAISDLPGTPLTAVYDAMRLERLQTSDGATSYRPGSPITFRFELINRSDKSLELPLVDYNGRQWYAAGSIQTWIERLGPDADQTCLPAASRKEDWYALSGWVVASTDPVAIEPGARMPEALEAGLTSEQTDCLPPGDYRLHVEYKPLDGELEDVLAERSLRFTITAPAVPTPTVGPTPSPSPRPPTPVPTAAPTPAGTTPPPAP
jgi:hypothetical protein